MLKELDQRTRSDGPSGFSFSFILVVSVLSFSMSQSQLSAVLSVAKSKFHVLSVSSLKFLFALSHAMPEMALISFLHICCMIRPIDESLVASFVTTQTDQKRLITPNVLEVPEAAYEGQLQLSTKQNPLK